MKEHHTDNYQRAKGALMGFIVGDALGVPYEFLSREEMTANPATGMTGFGTYDQPPGTWSDDTSMLLCIMENEILSGNVYTLADRFVRWYEDGYMTPHDVCFDIGITTRTALERCIAGIDPCQSGLDDPRSAGNGSLMRIAPYAFRDMPDARHHMLEQNGITHRAPLAQISCMAWQEIFIGLLDGKEPAAAISDIFEYFERIVRNWLKEGHEQCRDVIGRIRHPRFSELPASEIQSSGFVVHTLEASLWCLLQSTDYRSAVLNAVNLGEDTDTTAAVTGALAGAYYGIQSIPADWIDALVRREHVEMMIDKFLEHRSRQ
jgi:ADP-ribosyl-[dinitrogen reductase] hydrolase